METRRASGLGPRASGLTLILIVLAIGGLAAAEAEPGRLVDWIHRVDAALGEASRARVPPPVPPVPVKVAWKARRRASLELGAPVATMVAGDVDGDGHAEVYLVTEASIIALATSP